jgi:hypothetical protein
MTITTHDNKNQTTLVGSGKYQICDPTDNIRDGNGIQ